MPAPVKSNVNILDVIRKGVPQFLEQMNVPFFASNRRQSVMEPTNSQDTERKTLESIMQIAASAFPIGRAAGAAMKASPKLAGVAGGVGSAAVTGDPADVLPGVGAILAGSPQAEAAFITPRAGAKNVRRFLDSVLEHVPNPPGLQASVKDPGVQMLHYIYGQTKEGRDILKATGIPNIPVRVSENMPINARGGLLTYKDTGLPAMIEINALPVGGEFAPEKTLIHEVQHLIDVVQKRPSSGTSPKNVTKQIPNVQSTMVQRSVDENNTIDKMTLEDIMSYAEGDVYLRETGENRARIDANQVPQFPEEDTWYVDPLSGKYVDYSRSPTKGK